MAQTMASPFFIRDSAINKDLYDVGTSTERLSKEEGCSTTSNFKRQSIGGETFTSL